MNYINIASGQVTSIAVIREAHPNMSIPEGADLSGIGYRRILPALEVPDPGEGQIVVQRPPQLIAGQWREVFAVEPAPVVVPQTITRAQGKIALIMSGRWPAVLAHVEAIADPTAKAMAEVALHDTLNWERASPTVAQMAEALNMTSGELDQLFISAAKVVL